MQEFLDGEEHCHNFINQDLTFLQLSTIYHTTDADDNQSIASDSTDASMLTVIENDQSLEVDSTPAFTSATALPEDFVHTDYDHTPIQSVEPSPIQPVELVIELTAEEQRQAQVLKNQQEKERLKAQTLENRDNTDRESRTRTKDLWHNLKLMVII